ncbi:MAG: S-layer homology domain-containing protein [Chloroflexota bacterium]
MKRIFTFLFIGAVFFTFSQQAEAALVTRGQYVESVISDTHTREEIRLCDRDQSGFPDVSSEFNQARFICAAKQSGIVEGYPDGFFRPDDPVSSEELAKITVLAYGLDHQSGEEWYDGYVQSLREIELFPVEVGVEMSEQDTSFIFEHFRGSRDKTGNGKADLGLVSQSVKDTIAERNARGLLEWQKEHGEVLQEELSQEERSSNISLTQVNTMDSNDSFMSEDDCVITILNQRQFDHMTEMVAKRKQKRLNTTQ